MAAFGGLTLTTRGLALQAKVQAGTPLQFNRIAIGDGQVTNQTVTALNALLSQKLNLTLTGTVAKPPNRATVSGKLTNSTISTGFYFREIGLFAQDPVDGEILYAYGNSGASAEFIPPGGGADILERLIELDVIVGTAANVSATIDSSLVFVTQKDFSSHTHDGTTGNGPKITSSGLAAGAVTDAIIGNRTVSDATAPTGDTGTPTMLFGWLANMVKAITGKSSWRTAPAISLEATRSHVDATAGVHGAVSSAIENRIIQRDANGRAQVAAPSAAGDIARKAEVDTVQSTLSVHAAESGIHVSSTDRSKWNNALPSTEFNNWNLRNKINEVGGELYFHNVNDANGSKLRLAYWMDKFLLQELTKDGVWVRDLFAVNRQNNESGFNNVAVSGEINLRGNNLAATRLGAGGRLEYWNGVKWMPSGSVYTSKRAVAQATVIGSMTTLISLTGPGVVNLIAVTGASLASIEVWVDDVLYFAGAGPNLSDSLAIGPQSWEETGYIAAVSNSERAARMFGDSTIYFKSSFTIRGYKTQVNNFGSPEIRVAYAN
ncbi:phage tail protein [Gorillibacterium sp. CAU 1737]|uniref:phage tail-collar fiber domain-containing protein n=1 Tax=Gorillibacterium sp. CAU 1737 TaxID=3140362 RepID=UPI0032607A1E